jgi:hypothetical protein
MALVMTQPIQGEAQKKLGQSREGKKPQYANCGIWMSFRFQFFQQPSHVTLGR